MQKTVRPKAKDVSKDDIISAILDELWSIKGWGPEGILPEYSLGKELELDGTEIACFALRLTERLHTDGRLDFSAWRELSLRQVVDQIQNSALKSA